MATNIIFIDSRAARYETLIADLPEGTEWYLLDADRDGIEQIASFLIGRTGVDSIQIVSHGSVGSLYLGSTWLNSANLAQYQTQLSEIGQALTETGDILLYGCDVAQGDVGLQFINSLAQFTGADVAASTDATGAAALGGNWVLEEANGSVETAALYVQEYWMLLASNTAPTFIAGDGKLTTTIGSRSVGYSVALQSDGKILVAGTSDSDFALARYNTDGSLDTSFSGDGKLTTAIGLSSDQGQSVTLQSDGKILVAGTANIGSSFDFALARYNTDGSLDTSFSGDGKLTTDFGSSNDSGYSVTVQADGKILVAGQTYISGTDDFGTDDFALARYNADGSLDTSFSGDGKLTTAIGLSSDQGQSVTLQSDGKILVAGTAYISGTYDFALVRYNTDGSLDTSFSGDGKLTTAIGLSSDQGQSVTLQSDGKILVAGTAYIGSSFDFALARYNTDGSLDTSFSGDGKLTTDFGSSTDNGYSVALQSDGKILVAGRAIVGSHWEFALARYNIDGGLDTSFSADGKLTSAFYAFSADYGFSVTVQSDGKIVVAGSSIDNFAVVRYNTDGSLDLSFDPQYTLNENPTTVEQTIVLLDGTVQVYDIELSDAGNYAGATLTFSRHGGADGDDQFFASGNLFAFTQGSVLVLSGIIIGTVTQDSAGALVLTFNSNATQARVNEAMSSIKYLNISDNPPASVQIDWTFSDGNTGAQGDGGELSTTGSTTVTITPVNDAPTLVTPEAASYTDTVDDDSFTATTGTLAGLDPDNTLTYGISGGTIVGAVASKTGSYGTLTLDTATGAYTFTPNDTAIEGLKTNTSETYIVTASDGTTTANANFIVNLIGANDTTSFGGSSTGTVTEDGTLEAGGTLTVSDRDTGDSVITVQVNKAGTYGSFNIGTSGEWRYTLNNTDANVQALTAGQLVTDTFTVATAGGDTQNVSVTITGAGNVAPTFLVGYGKLTTDIGSSRASGQSVTIQADGKILVAGSSIGNFALVRYNTDGSLDTSFSGDGKLTTDFGSSSDSGQSVTVQADGKILVAGNFFNGSNSDFALARYNTDGSLDTSFSGDGKLATDFGASYDFGYSAALQSDGKILVAGISNGGFALARYNTDGSLDTSFDGDGKLTTVIGLGNVGAYSVTVQADGKILVAGSAYIDPTQDDFVLVRYNSDGSLDTSFSGDGKLTTDFGSSTDNGYSVALQSDGKILVAGQTYISGTYDFALARYNTDGSLDTSFSGDGKLTTAIGLSTDIGSSVTVQADGKILVAGSASNGSKYDFAMVRYNADGSLDTNFSGDGKLTTDFGFSYDYGYSVTVQADGKILVAGSASDGINSAFALARYNADGSLDASFDPQYSLNTNPTTLEQTAVLLDSTVLIHDVELSAAGNYFGATLTLSRHGVASVEDQFSASANLSALTQDSVLVLSGISIGTVTQNSAGALVLTFNSNATQARVSQAMSSIRYLNSSDNPPASVQIDWTFSDGNTGAQGDGGALSTTGSTTVTITPVNDAPTGTNATLSMAMNEPHTFSLADFGFFDEDATLTAVRIDTVPLAGKGALLYDGAMMLAGLTLTAADISGGHLAYRPATDAGGLSYASFTFSVKDSSGLFDASPNTLTLDVILPNQAPTTTNLSAAESYTEDTPLNLTDIVISDVDSANVTATLSLSNAAAGALSTATSGTVTSAYDAGTGVWSATGATADVNTLLAGVNFSPTLNFNADFSITASVSDGVAPAITGSKNFTGTAIDDAASGLLTISGAVKEGTTIGADTSDLSDVDGGIASMAYQWQINTSDSWTDISGATTSSLSLPGDQSYLGSQIRLSAVSTDAYGGMTSFTSAAQTVTELTSSTSIDLLAYSWKAHTLLEGAAISGSTYSGITNASGALSFAGVTEPSLTLTAARPVPAAEVAATDSAVNLQDAIAILKMIVGLDVNGAGKALSPYQSLAADFDGNGAVGLIDAIGVLKHVVGLTAPEPTWHFLNEVDPGVPGKTGLNPGVPANTINADLGTGRDHIGLVAYLSGDVDGSFAGAAGALDLDATQPGYFQELTSAQGLHLSQFGIYTV